MIAFLCDKSSFENANGKTNTVFLITERIYESAGNIKINRHAR